MAYVAYNADYAGIIKKIPAYPSIENTKRDYIFRRVIEGLDAGPWGDTSLYTSDDLVLMWKADFQLKNQVPGNKNRFLSNVLGPQYNLQADGSYIEAADNVPVDVIGGRKMLRTCGAVTNLFTTGMDDFTQTWISSRVTRTANSFLETVDNGTHIVYSNCTGLLASTAHTFSVDVKANGREYIYLNLVDPGIADYRTWFLLSGNGTVATKPASVIASIQALSDGWYRLSITRVNSASQIGVNLQVGTATGDGIFAFGGDTTRGCYLRNPQLTASAYPLPYTPPGTTMPASHTTTTNGPWFGLPQYDDAETSDGLYKRDGVELVVNGGFDDDLTGWAFDNSGNTNWSWDNGAALVVGAEVGLGRRNMTQSACVAGQRYSCSFDVSNYTGNVTLYNYGNANALKTASGNGRFVCEFVAVGAVIAFYSTAIGTKIDNISIQKLIPAARTNRVWAALDGEPDGVELVANGGFDSDTVWTTKGAGWSISGGVAVANVANYTTIAQGAAVVGQRYLVKFDVVSISGGSVKAAVGGTYGVARSTPGRYAEILVATNTTGFGLISSASNLTGTFDNISIQRIQPKPMTLAWRGVMGVGSGDLAAGAVLSGVDCSAISTGGVLYSNDFEGNGRIVRASDGSTSIAVNGEWDRNSCLLRFTQVNAGGTEYRSGVYVVGISSSIIWSIWKSFDGSFGPSNLYKLLLGYNNPHPLWHDTIALWDKQIDDATLLKEMLK